MTENRRAGNRMVFLDRDGTLIFDKHYLGDPELVEFMPSVVDGLSRLQEAGWMLAIVTNQSGVARGLITENDVDAVNARVLELLRADCVSIAGIYICVHGPLDSCECRKPLPGLILKAGREQGVELSGSWMIGDRVTDIESGQAAGTRTVLIHGDKTEENHALVGADATVSTFEAAVDVVLGNRLS